MKRIHTRLAVLAAAFGTAVAAGAALSGTAQAENDSAYFAAGGYQCVIRPDGAVGCDFPGQMRLQYSFLPIPIPVDDVVIDQPWLPAHPSFLPGAPFTLPGGNPQLYTVKTGDGAWGPYIEHAGARCESGFHGSFTCTSKGRSFSVWSGIVNA